VRGNRPGDSSVNLTCIPSLRDMLNTTHWSSSVCPCDNTSTIRLLSILVDIRTDLHTCCLGVFIAKNESGTRGHMPEGHMTGDRQGETNYERNAGCDPKIRRTKVISRYTKVYRRCLKDRVRGMGPMSQVQVRGTGLNR
jgi:hypothetical protein